MTITIKNCWFGLSCIEKHLKIGTQMVPKMWDTLQHIVSYNMCQKKSIKPQDHVFMSTFIIFICPKPFSCLGLNRGRGFGGIL